MRMKPRAVSIFRTQTKDDLDGIVCTQLERAMLIYLFRDESEDEIFAFSTDVTGKNIPPATPHTEWIFHEVINTLKFPEPWDITDFQEVLEHLREKGYYLFEGQLVDHAALKKPRGLSPKC